MHSNSHPWAELAARLVERLRPRRPEETRAMALLVLENALDPRDFVEGVWITLACVHRYVHFDGRGWGDARTLRLCEQVVETAHAMELIGDWDRELLLDDVDRSREGLGLAPRRKGRVRDRVFLGEQLTELATRFAADAGHPLGEKLVRTAVRLVATFAGDDEHHGVRFGRFDPDAVALFLREHDRDPSVGPGAEQLRREANRDFLAIAASFYRWLAERDHLCPARAAQIAQRCREHALAATSTPAAA